MFCNAAALKVGNEQGRGSIWMLTRTRAGSIGLVGEAEASVVLEVLAGVEHDACGRAGDVNRGVGVAVQGRDQAGAGQLLEAAGMERQAPRGRVDGARALGDEDIRGAGDPSIVGRQVHVQNGETDQARAASQAQSYSQLPVCISLQCSQAPFFERLSIKHESAHTRQHFSLKTQLMRIANGKGDRVLKTLFVLTALIPSLPVLRLRVHLPWRPCDLPEAPRRLGL
jgi:hypothetical protein